MSSNQPTLFGAFPWADGSASSPTLYGSGYIPQTFSVNLSETVIGTEADIVNTIKALSETVTLTEAQIKAITKVLSDSATLSDATVVKTIQKILADTLSIGESNVVFFTIKSLSDFLIVKEWISIRLNKSITWVNPSTDAASWVNPSVAPAPTWINPAENANIFDTLWGRYQFGRVLFGGLKPLASWSAGQRGQSPWTNQNGHKYNS